MTVRNRKPRSLMIPDEEGNSTNNNRLRQQQQQDDNNGTPVIKKKPVGLVNLGNTCFMNAALQCLCRTPGLLEKLELLISEPMLTFTGSGLTYNDEQVQNNELKFKLVFASESIVKKMVHLLRQMTQGSGGDTVNPRTVHHVMAKNFGAGLQHDSHELLRHILDKLKKDQIRADYESIIMHGVGLLQAFRIALMDLFGIPHNEAGKILQTDPQKAQELKDWDKKLYNSTVIDDIFGGELLTTRTCLECGAVKNSTEEFLDISLPIRVVKSGNENKSGNSINNRYFPSNELTTINRTLRECFQCFVEPETLSQNNKVDCERCHEQKLNKIKAGVPVNEVFPPEESPKSSTFQSSKTSTTNSNKLSNARSQKQTPQKQGNNQKESKRKKKKRKTRKEKMAEDPLPENMSPEKEGAGNSSNSEPDVPELEKITDEGYAEDYKDSDDSTGASAGDNDATPSDEAQDDEEEEDNENDGDKRDADADEEKADGGDDEDEDDDEEAPRPVKQPEIPKSTKTACKRWTMIYRPPKNLTVHLKRFTVSARGYTQKLTDHVKFTEYIDIREYVTTSFPNDDQTSQVSSNSWSFEEMSKEVDVALGGASGDSAVDSSDRFIVAPTASLTTSVIKSTDEGGDYDVQQNPDVSSPTKPEPEVAGPSSSSNFIIQPPPITSEMSPSSNNVEAGTVTTVTGEIETDPVISQEDADNSDKAFVLPETFDSGNDMDDEPPPYGVSPTPDDYSSNQLRTLNDVPLPEPDYTAGWSLDYKSSQGIAEWSAKGIEGGEEVDSVDLPTTVPQEEVPAGPLPMPATSSWDTPAAEGSSSSRPAVIALGYSSIEDVQFNRDLTTSLEAQVTKEAVDDDDDDDDVMNLGPTLLGDTFEEANNTTSSSMLNRIESGGEAEEVKLDPNGINYRLYGIVEHGGSLNWGHYVAYVRVGSEWYYISDSYVSKSDIKSVLDRDPYILFYERVP